MSDSLVLLGVGCGAFGFAFRWVDELNEDYLVGLGTGAMIGAYLTTLYADTEWVVGFLNSPESAILLFSFILGWFLGGVGHQMWRVDDV